MKEKEKNKEGGVVKQEREKKRSLEKSRAEEKEKESRGGINTAQSRISKRTKKREDI